MENFIAKNKSQGIKKLEVHFTAYSVNIASVMRGGKDPAKMNYQKIVDSYQIFILHGYHVSSISSEMN